MRTIFVNAGPLVVEAHHADAARTSIYECQRALAKSGGASLAVRGAVVRHLADQDVANNLRRCG